MIERDNFFEETNFSVQLLNEFFILPGTNNNQRIIPCTDFNLLLEGLLDEWRHSFLQFLIVVIVVVHVSFHKSQRTNRTDEKIFVELFNSAELINHVVNKLARQLSFIAE